MLFIFDFKGLKRHPTLYLLPLFIAIIFHIVPKNILDNNGLK
jgi:hypothetical protein